MAIDVHVAIIYILSSKLFQSLMVLGKKLHLLCIAMHRSIILHDVEEKSVSRNDFI